MKEEILFHQFASIAIITYINTPTVLSFFKTDARRRSNAHPGNQKKVKRKKKQAQAIDREDQLKFGLVWCFVVWMMNHRSAKGSVQSQSLTEVQGVSFASCDS